MLGRLKSNRCLYRLAPAPTGNKGAPRKDGDKLQPKDPTTHGKPDGTYKGMDAKGRPVEVTCWKRMHIKEARWLQMTVLRVVRLHATNKERDPRVSWFIWIGDQEADVLQIALGYVLRFGQEHGYRFDKQALLWEKPRLRTPAQFERWTQIVAIAHNHLVVARDLVEAELRRLSKTSSVRRPHNRCDAGSANCCHVWGPLPDPPNLAENRKAGSKGRRLARRRGFRSFAKSRSCLNLYQRDDCVCTLSTVLSFYRTSGEVLVGPVSLNINNESCHNTIKNSHMMAYLPHIFLYYKHP